MTRMPPPPKLGIAMSWDHRCSYHWLPPQAGGRNTAQCLTATKLAAAFATYALDNRPPLAEKFGIPGSVVSLLFSSNISGLGVRLFTGAGCTGNAIDFWPVNPIDCENFHDGLPWGAESFLVF
ncbi:hypothetical protein M441DRAFT_449620 [Trichoderma asperellum CBS 433.97]|uniref:Uncharacterized protein n=1 Tax=Trichoderma asperellum (strain ATCC 204424 / CBS 433.97 / NBRC 101777) TaxID=1042311 RepID=A0A2T3YU77_TRIA4|nr:hypothetical protein M441DRAFT_449620 [Trichoderma asperellum CBS 433.97]PTB36131.1 hypothetical protein M441DRAFT_449620 [Trichoderma asperellum CBS 433.97]